MRKLGSGSGDSTGQKGSGGSAASVVLSGWQMVPKGCLSKQYPFLQSDSFDELIYHMSLKFTQAHLTKLRLFLGLALFSRLRSFARAIA